MLLSFRNQQNKQSLYAMEKVSNETLTRLQKDIQSQSETLNARHQVDVQALAEKLKEVKRNAKNQWVVTPSSAETEQQESREMQLIREMKDSFTAAIRELNVKVQLPYL